MAIGPRKMGMRKMPGMKRAGAKMPKSMKAPKAMGPAMMEGQVPPMAGPMPQGMKKGGMVGKGKTPASARMDYEKKMKAAGKKPLPAAKGAKGGLGIMIILGKKKGK